MSGMNAKERSRLLNVRLQMIARCCDPDNPHYANYGGRGIGVCARWLESPRAFIEDIGARPKGMTLDRIDNSGDYCPENIRWASRAEQVRNRRNSITVEIDGEVLNLADACAKRGLPYTPIFKRIASRGWSVEDAFSIPLTRANRGKPHGSARKHLREETPQSVRMLMAG